MKKLFRNKWIYISLFCVLCLSFFAWVNIQKGEVLIIYNKQIHTDNELAQSLIKTLNIRNHYRIDTIDSSQKPSSLVYDIEHFNDNKGKPDVVVAINVVAQNLAKKFYLNDKHTKIIFAGATSLANRRILNEKNNITGIIYRMPYKAMIDFLHDINFQGKRIMFVGDDTPSNVEDIKKIKTFIKKHYQMTAHLSNEFSTWQKTIAKANQDNDLLIVLDYDNVSGADGKLIPTKEMVEWLVKTAKIPMMSSEADFAKHGGPIAFFPYQQNSDNALVWLIAHIIDQPRNIEYPYIEMDEVAPSINIDTYKQFFKGYPLPAIYLSYARAILALYHDSATDFIVKAKNVDTKKEALVGNKRLLNEANSKKRPTAQQKSPATAKKSATKKK